MTDRVGTKLGTYVIEAPLGSGGMGVVYRARDTTLERTVAIKFLPRASSAADGQRVLDEARAASSLNHPNICTVHEFGEADGQPFIVMEHIEGTRLSDLIPRDGLPLEQVVSYGAQMADALGHAHDRRVIHRDVKPANIIVTPDGRAKMLDFGLARRLGNDALLDVTRAATPAADLGVIAGTPTHMPPEVLRGAESDTRSDVWALGVVLYQMATGHLPFDRTTTYALITAIVQDRPGPFTARVPAALQSIILRCLEKDPARRYQRVSEVRAALDLVRDAGMGDGVPSRRHKSVMAVAAVALAVAAIALAVTMWRRPRAVLPGAQITSLAVLPLSNYSRDPSQDYFVDGMTEALIADLAQIKSLRVISRTSAMRYKGTSKSVPEIARELGVDALLEGSVVRDGDRVRITAQLIRATSDEHMWAASYERDLRDVLTLQGEVARAIAIEVRSTLTPQAETRLARVRPVAPAAYEAYLRGRFHWNQRTGESLTRAVALFQQAVGVDPGYAPAYAGLAGSYFLLSSPDVGSRPPREFVPKAKAAAEKALDLDESLAEALAPLAYARLLYDWDWAAADREFRRAIELDPNYATAHFWYGVCLAAAGRFQEAIAEATRAQQLDPVSPIINTGVSYVHHYARHDDEAIVHARKALDLTPDFPIGLLRLGVAFKHKGMFDEAIRTLQQATIVSGSSTGSLSQLGAAYASAGRVREANDVLDRLLGMARNGSAVSHPIALVNSAFGDADRTFTWLDRAYDERSPGMAFLNVDPDFDRVRSDPRFPALVRRVGLIR